MSTAVKCKGCGNRKNREECRVTDDRQVRCLACYRDLETRKVRLTDLVPRMSPKRTPDATAPRRKWLASKDGIAHTSGPYDRWRALCGATQVLERLAWPEERRCRVCVALDAGQTAEREAQRA